MTERDKLQAALREYYAAQSFEAPAGTWQEVAAQQGLRPSRRKRKVIILLFLIAGLAGLVGTFYWQVPADPQVAVKTVELLENKKNSEPNAPAPSDKAVLIADNNITTFKSKTSTLPTPSNKAFTPKQGTTRRETLTNTNKGNDNPAVIVSPINAVVQATKTEASGNNNAGINTNELLVASEEISNTNNESLNNAEESGQAPPAKGTEEDLKITGLTPQAPDVKAINSLSTSNSALPVDTSKGAVMFSSTQLSISDTSRVLQKSESVATTTIVSNDSVKASIRPHFYFNEGLHVDLGTYYSYGWKTADKRDARGFTASAGVYYSSKINARLWVSGGLRYFEVRNLSYSSKTARSSSFTYGENVVVTTITPVSLHYLSVPISAMYALTTKHQIGIASNLNYLLNVNANVASIEQRPGYTGTTTTTKQSGYMQGFSWFDSQIALLYRYRFNSSMAAQAALMAGIKDVKENVFFNLQQKERNSGIRISFVYYLKNASTRDVQ